MLKGNVKLGGYGMSLFVTSRCNLWCKECIMRGLMKNRKYEMSLDELTAFIDVTEKSGYKFHYMLTGGEPLIWKNLKEGVKLLRQSLSCNYLYLFTNLVNHEALDDEVMSCLNCVKVSQYAANESEIHEVKRKYGDKVKVYDRRKFWINPKEKIDINTPVVCMNEGELLFQNYHVYACLHSASIAAAHKNTEITICKPLELGYMDGLDEIRTNQARDICSLCTSNKEIRDMMSKPEHTSQLRILI